MPHKEAKEFCGQFMRKFKEKNNFDFITLSIGIVSIDKSYPNEYMDVVTAADKELYKAKDEGKDRICARRLSKESIS